MKVLNLGCTQQHAFEGWFAGEDDFRQQLDAGLLTCPVCGDTVVHKLPSAPRLNFGHGREPDGVPVPVSSGQAERAAVPALQGQALRALRELVQQTEDVGERFADEARAMHQGDIEQRPIRGQTTPKVALELLDEGIEIVPLPSLPLLKETLQ